MAKDDYDVLVFKILVYFYAVLKREIVYTDLTFKRSICYDDLAEGYLYDVIDMMQEDGYIKGMTFSKVWGNEQIPLNGFEDLTITSDGIKYLNENRMMAKVKDFFLEHPTLITSLITKLF